MQPLLLLLQHLPHLLQLPGCPTNPRPPMKAILGGSLLPSTAGLAHTTVRGWRGVQRLLLLLWWRRGLCPPNP